MPDPGGTRSSREKARTHRERLRRDGHGLLGPGPEARADDGHLIVHAAHPQVNSPVDVNRQFQMNGGLEIPIHSSPPLLAQLHRPSTDSPSSLTGPMGSFKFLPLPLIAPAPRRGWVKLAGSDTGTQMTLFAPSNAQRAAVRNRAFGSDSQNPLAFRARVVQL
jgi:hypothetical protein